MDFKTARWMAVERHPWLANRRNARLAIELRSVCQELFSAGIIYHVETVNRMCDLFPEGSPRRGPSPLAAPLKQGVLFNSPVDSGRFAER